MTQSTLERVAYGAIGAPTVALKQLSKKLNQTRDMLDKVGERLSESARAEIEAWAKEGEVIVDRMTTRIRNEAPDRLVSAVGVARDTMGSASTMLTEPTVELGVIKGIGPASAAVLHRAGVLTTNVLVERMHDPTTAKRLSRATGISEDKLRDWSDRADLTRVSGIGNENRRLLQWIGIGSVIDLAGRRAVELTTLIEARANELNLGVPIPSQATVSGWISSAKSLMR